MANELTPLAKETRDLLLGADILIISCTDLVVWAIPLTSKGQEKLQGLFAEECHDPRYKLAYPFFPAKNVPQLGCIVQYEDCQVCKHG